MFLLLFLHACVSVFVLFFRFGRYLFSINIGSVSMEARVDVLLCCWCWRRGLEREEGVWTCLALETRQKRLVSSDADSRASRPSLCLLMIDL